MNINKAAENLTIALEKKQNRSLSKSEINTIQAFLKAKGNLSHSASKGLMHALNHFSNLPEDLSPSPIKKIAERVFPQTPTANHTPSQEDDSYDFYSDNGVNEAQNPLFDDLNSKTSTENLLKATANKLMQKSVPFHDINELAKELTERLNTSKNAKLSETEKNIIADFLNTKEILSNASGYPLISTLKDKTESLKKEKTTPLQDIILLSKARAHAEFNLHENNLNFDEIYPDNTDLNLNNIRSPSIDSYDATTSESSKSEEISTPTSFSSKESSDSLKIDSPESSAAPFPRKSSSKNQGTGFNPKNKNSAFELYGKPGPNVKKQTNKLRDSVNKETKKSPPKN